jgi:hypothetical protein
MNLLPSSKNLLEDIKKENDIMSKYFDGIYKLVICDHKNTSKKQKMEDVKPSLHTIITIF